MSPYAFVNRYGFEVDQTLYDKHRSYDYATHPAVGRRPVPYVLLGLQNVITGVSRRVGMNISTSASVSRLSGHTADRLGIGRRMGPADRAIVLSSMSGHPVVGVARNVSVFLGGVTQEIRVAVEPDQVSMRLLERKHGLDISPCKQDILGRADILENYLLCLNAERLYAFRRL